MSTSIYSGYKLNGNYDFVSLNNFLMKLQKEVTKICEQKIFDRVVRQTLYYYNFNQLHGSDAVQSMIERTSQSKKTKDRCEIWKSTLHNDWYDVYLKNYSKILISAASKDNFRRILQAELQMIPVEDKILVMYFGDEIVRKYLETKTDYFSDYHYQDQTDRPENISESEWKHRCADWDKAIGPDYIPSHHGWSVELFDAENSVPLFSPTEEIFEFNFPSIDDAVTHLRENLTSISLVEGYLKRYSRWEGYNESDAYKQWESSTNELIRSKCNFITTKEDFLCLLGLNKDALK